jgi:hypothetical protein
MSSAAGQYRSHKAGNNVATVRLVYLKPPAHNAKQAQGFPCACCNQTNELTLKF